MRKIWQRKNDVPVCHFNKDLSDQKLVLEVEKYFLLSKKVLSRRKKHSSFRMTVIFVCLVDRPLPDQGDVSAHTAQGKHSFGV